MGTIIQKNKRLISILRVLLILTLSIFLILPGICGAGFSIKKNYFSDQKIVTKVSRHIEIPAGSDYYVKFHSENLTLEEQKIEPYSKGLSEKVKSAIAKSPNWIQRKLTRQFQSLNNPEEYADLILNVSKQYADEIAFSISLSQAG